MRGDDGRCEEVVDLAVGARGVGHREAVFLPEAGDFFGPFGAADGDEGDAVGIGLVDLVDDGYDFLTVAAFGREENYQRHMSAEVIGRDGCTVVESDAELRQRVANADDIAVGVVCDARGEEHRGRKSDGDTERRGSDVPADDEDFRACFIINVKAEAGSH